MLLDSLITPGPKRTPLLLLEHDLTRSTIPIIRELIRRDAGLKQVEIEGGSTVILTTFLHPPCVFVRKHPAATDGGNVLEKDYTGFSAENESITYRFDVDSLKRDFMEAIESVRDVDSVSLIIDSVDTLAGVLGSTSSTLRLLKDVAERIEARKVHSGLILSITSSSALLPHILPPSFAQTLTHLRLYHPSIILHLHKNFLLPPPPISTTARFYSIFTPFVQRDRREPEALFFNPSRDTSRDIDDSETILEISARSAGLRKGVDRDLTGWKEGVGPCSLAQLESLSSCFETQGPWIPIDEKSPSDPTQNLPFNLNLTTEQQESRARVPLPYAHTGGVDSTVGGKPSSASIYYDPDSADDFDDEDPDEDLDL